MKNFFSVFFCLFSSALLLIFAGCSANPKINDSSSPLPFIPASPHAAEDLAAKEDDSFVRNIITGKWECLEESVIYTKTIQEIPGEINISSAVSSEKLPVLKIFAEDGTCSFENDMLIGLFSAGGRKNSAKGKWQVKDGILHITLFPEKTSEAAFSEIKLSANICVINAKSVSVYWTPETVKSCFELLKKAAAKKTSPDNKTFFTDKFTLWYGLDDHVYIELVKRSEIHVNYNEVKKTEQHIKTTSPTYIKK